MVPLLRPPAWPTKREAEHLNALVESLRPLKEQISEKPAYVGSVLGFAAYGFSLFLPWSTVPAGIAAQDGGSSSGWAEGAYAALIPMVGLALALAGVRRPNRVGTFLMAVAASFLLVGYNNVANRTTWQRQASFLLGIPHPEDFGSTLGAGFWIGLLALVATAGFGVAWTLHREAAAGQGAPPVAEAD